MTPRAGSLSLKLLVILLFISSNAWAEDGYYGAIAVARYRLPSGADHVATGIGWNFPTRAEAENAALAQCADPRCAVRATFQNGECGYVTTGRTAAGGACFGTGSTPQEADEQCSEAGCTRCQHPKGGCTGRPAASAPRELSVPVPPTVTWKLRKDFNGRVALRFFTSPRGGVWPSSDKVWTLDDLEEHTYSMTCTPGENVCYGAVDYNAPRGGDWGVGLDGEHGCAKCCAACGGGEYTSTLTLH
jgi:hypothetical protein